MVIINPTRRRKHETLFWITFQWKSNIRTDNLVYPNKYMVTSDFAKKFDKKKVGSSIEVRVIPISKLKKHDEPLEGKDKYVKELEDLLFVAVDCLDNIIITQANSSKYRSMAKDALSKIIRSPHTDGIQIKSSTRD